MDVSVSYSGDEDGSGERVPRGEGQLLLALWYQRGRIETTTAVVTITALRVPSCSETGSGVGRAGKGAWLGICDGGGIVLGDSSAKKSRPRRCGIKPDASRFFSPVTRARSRVKTILFAEDT
jgi:hypothetical protein